MLSRIWIFVLCVGFLSPACPLWPFTASGGRQAVAAETPEAPCLSAPPDDGQRVILQAETLEYLQQNKRLLATGNVRVRYGEKQLFADQLELYTDTNTGVAQGRVRFLTPEDDLTASRLEFDFRTERGVLYDASGKAAKIYQLAGERLERLEPRTLAVQRGRITTCTSSVPEWEFRSPNAQIGLGDYITMKHPSFWIKGIPVFYVPYFIFPIKDKRTTGFLPPRVGSSSEFGQTVRGEFFWAMTDWLDSTVGLEYLSKKGLKPEFELRYAIDPESDGQLEGAYLQESDTGEKLWRVLLQQRQDFGWGIRGLTQIDIRSETDIVRRFARTIVAESAIRTASFGSLTKVFPSGGITLEGSSYDGIPASGSTEQFRYLPRVSFSQFPTALPGGLLFALDTSYARMNTTNVLDNLSIQRLDLFPRVILPLSMAPWAGLAVTGGVRETLYDHRLTGADGIVRQVPEIRGVLDGPTLRRRFDGILPNQALFHTVTARLAYRYVPEVRQEAVPPLVTLDEEVHFLDPLITSTLVDRIQPAHYSKVSFINRFYTRQLGDTPVRSVRDVGHLILHQGLDIRQATEGGGSPVGPLDIEMALRPWQAWWIDSTLRIHPTTGVLQELLWRGGLNLSSALTLTVTNARRQTPEVHYLQGSVILTPLDGLRLTYSTRYDALNETVREHAVLVHYQGVCYKVDFSFRKRKAGDTEFLVQLNLLNL